MLNNEIVGAYFFLKPLILKHILQWLIFRTELRTAET